MKKVTALLLLTAATSLAACSHHGEYGYNNGYNNSYEESNDQNNGYNNSPQYTENTENMDRSHWQQKRQAGINMMVDELFSKCDGNSDGYISWKEYKTCSYRMFKEADSNHDGKLSRHEVYMHKLHKMRKMHHEMEQSRSENTSSNTSYNNTASYNGSYATGSGTRSYRDESSYQNLTPAAGEESEGGFNDNAYSNNGANVSRYNQTH